MQKREKLEKVLDGLHEIRQIVSGELSTRPLQLVVPIRWDTESEAAPERQARARSDGEYRPGNKTRVQERRKRKQSPEGGNNCRSRKIFVPKAIGGIVVRELFPAGGSRSSTFTLWY